MADETRAQAEAALKEVEAITANLLPEPKGELDRRRRGRPGGRGPRSRSARPRSTSSNTQSIIRFGSAAQAELQAISQEMLAGVRNKDVGPAGNSPARDGDVSLRGFTVDELDPNRKRSWWERLTGGTAPMAEFMARYETVQGQIDKITGELLQHEHTLLKDVKSLDKLYEKTLDFYDELALYIAAGEAKIAELDATTIPAKEAEVKAAPEDQGVMKAQELRDIRAARDDLERRVHDLKLTRQVTMQSLPSIRLVQENDKSLVTKINSTLVNTVPLWETQLAQAVTIHRGREAAGVVKEANDLTNDLLKKNAENLRTANAEIRTEMERGVFDIEAVREGERRPDRHDRGQPAHRRRGQGQARRGRAEPDPDGGRPEGGARLGQGQGDRHGRQRRRQRLTADGDGAPPPAGAAAAAGCGRGARGACRLRRRRGAGSPPSREASAAVAQAAPPAPRRGRRERCPTARSLQQFYASVEGDLIASGRMRRDVAPADVPFTTDDLVRDFVNIALNDEYADVGGRFVHGRDAGAAAALGRSRCGWR